tara:strand:+ start:1525 stop:1752 length:228 start_codon:yes stop_codon:yes gene_type:complete
MNLELLFAIAYLALGQFWWRRIVTASAALTEPEGWRQELIVAEIRGDLALLIGKGTFILLWPLALCVGWISSRLQ